MSRTDMLIWVNSKLKDPVKKIEDLGTGVSYCIMLEQLHPQCIGLKKIKANAKLEHEFLHNFKLLQAAFDRLGINKIMNVDRLIKGRFQDNLEFIQWFKKFYEEQSTQSTSTEDKTEVQTEEAKKEVPNIVIENPDESSINALKNEKEVLMREVEGLDRERTFYYEKLKKIEDILNEAVAKNVNVEWCKGVFNVLYATDDSTQNEMGDMGY